MPYFIGMVSNSITISYGHIQKHIYFIVRGHVTSVSKFAKITVFLKARNLVTLRNREYRPIRRRRKKI